jgi:hypothetical protein
MRRSGSVVTREQIQINGIPIRVHGSYERDVLDDAGQSVGEMEVAIIIRGRIPNKQFMQLIGRDQHRLEYLDGQRPIQRTVRIVNHSTVASGTGEATVFRHDIHFRELGNPAPPQSTNRSQVPADAFRPAPRPASPEPPAPVAKPAEPRLTATDPANWGDAIRQMRGESVKPKAPEAPLTVPELVAIESVLVNLRVEALIQSLEEAGLIGRGLVEERFRSLLADRFVAEAIPLVGETVANRAMTDVHPTD